MPLLTLQPLRALSATRACLRQASPICCLAAAAMAQAGGGFTLASQRVANDSKASPALPRSGMVGATVAQPSLEGGGAEVFMFGGYTEEGGGRARHATNETWVFAPDTGGWRLLDCAGPLPQARLVAQAVCCGGRVWLLGGWDPGETGNGGTILSDIWTLDPASKAWTRVEPAGEALPPISRFQACAAPEGDKVFIHTHRSVDSLLVLETGEAQRPTLRTLSVLPDPQLGAPESRGLHSMTLVGSRLFVFGGAPQRGAMLSDLWEIDTASQPLRWRALPAVPGVPAPHPRCSHAAAAQGGRYLTILGGSYYKEDGSGLQPLDDCWVLDTAAEPPAWREAAITGDKPSARNAALMAPLPDGRLLYHGGWYPFRESYADTYLLSLHPPAGA